MAKCIEGEIPFDLPEGWRWARLSDHYLFKNGTSKRSGKEGVSTPVLRLADLDETTIALNGVRAVVLTETERNKCDLQPNDLLFIRVNGSRTRVGSCFVVPSLNERYAFCDHLIRGKPVTSISSQFIAAVMGVNFIRESIDAGIVCAAGQNTISQGVLKSIIVPVPPLAEQRRIVDVLGKYLALVDGIERDRAELDVLLAQLKSKDVKNDTVIFTGSDGLRYEKRADGKGEAKCIEKEIPFEVPEGWSWSRMERLIQLTSGIDLAKADYNSEHNGIPYITGASNFENGSLIENRWTDKPKRISHRGDLLFTCKGTVGKMAINKFASAHIARQVMAINPYRGVDKLYLQQVLAWHVETIRRKAKGFIPGIERGVLLKALVPVPPLAEQRRIVRAIEAVISATSL